MLEIISLDLQERVISVVEVEGLSRRETARRYCVSASTAVKWLARYHRTGNWGPRPVGGDCRSRLPGHRDWFLALLAAEPDLTLRAIAARLEAAHGVRVDPSMLSRFFRGQGIRFKKKPRAAQRAKAS